MYIENAHLQIRVAETQERKGESAGLTAAIRILSELNPLWRGESVKRFIPEVLRETFKSFRLILTNIFRYVKRKVE